MRLFHSQGENKIIKSWAMYDWANSAFATTIMVAILPQYYIKVAGAALEPHIASSYWGYSNTIAMLTIAIFSPILGAIADYKHAKLKFIGGFAGIGILATSLLFLVQSGDWVIASIFYIIGRIGWSGANVFYDSLLPHVSNSKNIDRVSTYGYALGYLGGGILLIINIGMVLNPGLFFLANSESGVRISFLAVSLWWTVFSVPLFKNVKEPLPITLGFSSNNPVRSGFKRVKSTFRKIRKLKYTFLFLIAYWFYNDGIGTVMVMAVVFGTEIGIGQEHLLGAILAVQFIGIPFTILFGKLALKISSKRALIIGLIVYTLISIGGYFLNTALHFWILAIAVGMVQGGTQALSRSLFGLMIPKNQTAEFYGFFDISHKFSGVLGPAIFGVFAQISGSSRLGIISLIFFFITGIMLLLRINISEGIKMAKTKNETLTAF